MKKSKLLMLTASLFLVTSLVSCGETNTDDGVYSKDFVNALVKKYSLEPKNEAYTYTETIEETAVLYSFVLTCKAADYYDYVFNMSLTKVVEDGDVKGTITSSIDFIWGRFISSAFNATGSFVKGAIVDKIDYQFYGLVFYTDGTVGDDCFAKTNDGVMTEFSEYKPFNNSWKMTLLQINHLNAMSQELVGCYLW